MRYSHSFPLTQSDIDLGHPGDCWACPFALAMSRHGYEEALVKEAETFPFGYATCDDEDCDGDCDTCSGQEQPDSASLGHKYDALQFVYSFDSGDPVGPGTLIIHVDTEQPQQGFVDFILRSDEEDLLNKEMEEC